MKATSAVFGLGIALATALLTGCTAAATVAQSPSPTHSASKSPSPSPSASATQEPATCDNIVTPEALATMTSNGNVANPDFGVGEPLDHFLTYGGVACQWGPPGSDVVWVLAYSPLTPAQAETEKSALAAGGWTATPQVDGSEQWSTTDLDTYLGNDPRYVFRPGSWEYTLDVSSLAYFAR